MRFSPSPLWQGVATAMSCFLLAIIAHADETSWKPVSGRLTTPWTEKVDPAHPLPEYPRPQLVRPRWQNLNGLWDYAVTGGEEPGEAYSGKILVPFPLESSLSGVGKPLRPEQRLWYRRSFERPKLTESERLLLHFGAVDHHAVVQVNGQQAGEHRGGYDAFTFDITDLTQPGENGLVVAVTDTTGAEGEAVGKQRLAAIDNPGGIYYTPCSGIWQTVWLEVVPASYIERLRLTPDLDEQTLHVDAVVAGADGDKLEVQAMALQDGQIVAQASGSATEPLRLKINQPRAWSPDDPFLYDLQIRLRRGDEVMDEVASYFGMRKIALGKDRDGTTKIFLNGKPHFQAGPLDQGYWPDGIYTAPTDSALKYDIEMTKKFGFNMIRKHVKVEPARWYYWCDKLGVVVWQDMPSSHAKTGASKDKRGQPAGAERAAQFEKELQALVEQHLNHPCIGMWVVFNEGWGQYDTQRLTQRVQEWDPTRLVSGASGWHDRPVGDILDIHAYPGPAAPQNAGKRAGVLGEFGGLGLPTPGHTWVEQTWGYRQLSGKRALQWKYLDLWREVYRLRREAGLAAAVYTQTTDVETEANGLLTYDRRVVKMDADLVGPPVATGEFPPPPTFKPLAQTAESGAVSWRYTTDKPGDGWTQSEFKEDGWKSGAGGFGTKGTPDARIGTEWKTDAIWLRRTFELSARPLREPLLRIHHDEDAEIYLNGVLAAEAKGFTTSYQLLAITPEAKATLHPGENLIAVHCRQTKGNQYIDVGLVDLVPTPRKWKPRDMRRPRPPVIDPGAPSTVERPGRPPSDAIVLFNGTDLSNWKPWRSKADEPGWKVENGYMEVVRGTGGIQTKQKFGDCQIHIEWRTPAEVKGNSQGRGNSGVFIIGHSEVQVLDSYENDTYPDGQAAAIYAKTPPLVNASRGPGQWQTYDIIYMAPRYDENGKLIRETTYTVLHNGVLVHHAFGLGGGPVECPIGLQDHGNPVRFRNIWVRPLRGYDGVE